MTTLADLAPALQSLFGPTADALARSCGFVRRQRLFSGSPFLQTCVFTWVAHPDATLEQFTATAASLGLDVSPQAIDQRLDDAAEFFRRALQQALSRVVAASPRALPLLDRFAAVYLDDSTSIGLPAALAAQFPGCGGSTPAAGRACVKFLLRWEARSAQVCALQPHPGRAADTTLADGLPLPPRGSLRLADLGFFKLSALRELDR